VGGQIEAGDLLQVLFEGRWPQVTRLNEPASDILFSDADLFKNESSVYHFLVPAVYPKPTSRDRSQGLKRGDPRASSVIFIGAGTIVMIGEGSYCIEDH
jgi:hypothetical protein